MFHYLSLFIPLATPRPYPEGTVIFGVHPSEFFPVFTQTDIQLTLEHGSNCMGLPTCGFFSQ